MNKPTQIIVAILTILAYILIGIYLIGKNGFKTLSYMNSIFVVGFFSLAILSLATIQSKTNTTLNIVSIIKNYFKFVLLIVLSIVIVYIITVLSTSPFTTMLITSLIYISLGITGLYIVYQLIKNTKTYQSTSENQYIQLLTHLLFIIPCSIVETVQKIAKDIVNTHRYIYIILALEIIFIAGYVGLPKLWKLMTGMNHDILVSNNAIPLVREKTVGVVDENYHQGLAFTFYADNVPASSLEGSSYVPFIRIGEKTLVVSYNPKLESMRIGILGPAGVSSFDINNVSLQKWNKIVINRTASSLDVFVNGSLEYTGTHDLTVLYKDDVVVGRDTEGLHGGIRNVYLSREAPFDHTFIRAY